MLISIAWLSLNSNKLGIPSRHEMSLRDLNQISIEIDISETSQKHLKRDAFFVTSLRGLKYNSKKMSFFVTSLRHLKNISKKMSLAWLLWDVSSISQKRCLFRDVSETSQKHLSQVFLVFQKYVTKMISCDFRRVITISDKIDMGPSETRRKWNVLWEQCIDINQVCPVGWYLHESFGKSRIIKTQW